MQIARGVELQPDAVDQATSGSEKESVLQRIRKEQQLVRAIGSALGRIGDGSSGQCLSCGNEIAGERLGARTVGTVLHSVPRRLRAMS